MNEKKFTPGPWFHVDKYEDSAGEVVNSENRLFVEICNASIKLDAPEHAKFSAQNLTFLEPEEQKANANLIAAAPELLEALEFVMDKCKLYGPADAARGKAEAAIQKAYGK